LLLNVRNSADAREGRQTLAGQSDFTPEMRKHMHKFAFTHERVRADVNA
jgi:hypothetical protein